MNFVPPGPLSYTGDASVPYILKNFDPDSSDIKNFPVPTLWINVEEKTSFILVNKEQGVATWVKIGGIEGGYPITPYVVGPSAHAGYQTIQSAIDAANADGGGLVYIQPGTYTENLTLYHKVNLTGPTGINSYSLAGTSGSETLDVIINGNVTLDLSSAADSQSNYIENIHFISPGGSLITFLSNIALFDGNTLTIKGCILEGANGGYILNTDGFPYFYFINTDVRETTYNTSNFLTLPGTSKFCYLSAINSNFGINSVTPNTIEAGFYINYDFNLCLISMRIDASGASSFLYLSGKENTISYIGNSPGDPLIEFGSQEGYVNLERGTFVEGSGAIANSTSFSTNSFFFYSNINFFNTHVLGSNARGIYEGCIFNTSSTAALNMGSSQNITLSNCTINSSNNPSIEGTGTGTLNITGVEFLDNDQLAGTLTLDGGQTKTGSLEIVNAFTLPTVDGTSGQVMTTNGAGTVSWSSTGTGATLNIQTFTTSGTYTPTSGMEYCVIEVVGGGAGGGGASAGSNGWAAGSGGAGGYSRGVFDAATIGASQTVTIGAGGTGGTAPSSGGNYSNGIAGGTTSVGTLIQATGGAPNSSGKGGIGGVGSLGQFNVNGGHGDSSVHAGGTTGIGTAGPGGCSYFGGGGGGGSVNGPSTGPSVSVPGDDGEAFGSGGGGAAALSSGTAGGGDGAPGVVVITEFI